MPGKNPCHSLTGFSEFYHDLVLRFSGFRHQEDRSDFDGGFEFDWLALIGDRTPARFASVTPRPAQSRDHVDLVGIPKPGDKRVAEPQRVEN
jgi:hypothetical protein